MTQIIESRQSPKCMSYQLSPKLHSTVYSLQKYYSVIFDKTLHYSFKAFKNIQIAKEKVVFITG